MQKISFANYLKRFIIVSVGLIIAAYGVGLTVNAQLGVSPWDVFSQGVALQLTKITGKEVMMGTITQLTAALVIIADIALREKIGIGTLVDIGIFGPALNVFMKLDLLPHPETFVMRFICMLAGYIIWGFGIYVYMSVALGAGPKDSLFVAFAKKGMNVPLAKNSIEAVVLVLGWFMGGTVGIGTVVAVFAMGYIIDFWFKLFKFEVTKVENESVLDTAKNIKGLLSKNKV